MSSLDSLTDPAATNGVEDVDEVGEDVSGAGRLRGDAGGGSGCRLADGDVGVGVQQAVVTEGGQSL